VPGLPLSALLFGIALIPLQWFPGVPIPGMQVADPFFLLSALATVGARPALGALRPTAVAAVAVFLASALASAIAGGGDWLKLLGHLELGAIAILTGLWAAEPEGRRRVEEALLIAAGIAAITGVAGALLYYLGIATPLLNPHSGDLLAGNYPRVRGTMVRANMMASVVATGLMLVLVRPGLIRTKLPFGEARWLRTAVPLLMIAALMFSFSRTVAFALWVAAFVYVRQRGGWWRWTAWLAVLAAALAVTYVASRYQVLLDPTRPWAMELADEDGTRWVHASGTLRTALEHPLVGVGPGHAPAEGWTAHFTWLNVWAVLGLPAALALAALFVIGLARPARIGSGAWLALVLLCTDTLHRDVEDMRHLWVLFGLLALGKSPLGQEALPEGQDLPLEDIEFTPEFD